jgi:cytochrome c oxidase assembly factor CtaG
MQRGTRLKGSITGNGPARLIMWVPGGIVVVMFALLLFIGWLRESERRVALTEVESLHRAEKA